ncbi:M13 family metallopeptidase [Rhizomicrobium electricum]|uniref:M13 family metallopeptidase n=1 Tax=Rhizomicrobium electricum TaxID=480070 RepID=A0ABN1F8F5_9PROT|nr:M13 family metallopeptidase [Rhizomicrobium electricum]NIJ46778.1 putative metalloendopeptidase [Rhizomicrobium electricum]
MKRRLFAAACLVLAGCTTSAPPPPAPPPGPKAELGAWGVDLAGMDRSVKPGDDFFAYVNGNWEKQAVIPPDRSNIGTGQNLAILSEKRMKEIVADLEAKPLDRLTPDEKKLRDLYDGYMDEKAIEARGIEPVKADLDRIAGLKTLKQVAQMMGSPNTAAGSLYAFGVGIDDKNSSAYSVNVSAAGLGMPDRDYYLLDDPDIAKTREAYKTFIATMLELTGAKDATARAEKVLALETAIAKAHWELKDQRDADKMYAPMSFNALKKAAPQFPWDSFVADSGIPLKNGERQIIVGESTAIPVLAKIFAKTPVAVWRDYLTVQYLHNYAAYLPKRFDDANFAFYGTVLGGRTQQSDRQTRAVRLLDSTMGEAFGKLYVAKFFPPEAKAKVQKLVSNILKAYEEDIQSLTWMSDETRKKALEKIRKFTPYLGYPDTWRDYSAYDVSRDDMVGNIKRSAHFNWTRDVSRLDSPVDKAEWQMTTPTVNAYFMPPFNSITFPAAILQSPIFDPNADDAVNYGAIGSVIGHEISHGFDDQGSKYNGDGVLQNWWTEEDRKNFDARTKMLVKQYDAYEPLPGLHMRGEPTLGENIADLAGLSITLKAYRISLGGKPAPVLDGFTGDQRVFLGFGQVWRAKFRDNDLRRRILSDVHSPAPFRVRGSIRNMDDWYKAFDVKPGDKYYLPPEERVKLW